MKLESIEKKMTSWEGLWWHPECRSFYSKPFDLESLKKFKGNVRIFVKKNKYFNNGKNGRPNYLFSIQSLNADGILQSEAEETGQEDAESRFTYDEVQEIINKVACEIGGRGLYGKYRVSDFVSRPEGKSAQQPEQRC